jgi:hypothetical protein
MVTSRQGARSISLGLMFANSLMFNELELAPCISARILFSSRNSLFSTSTWSNDELENLMASNKESRSRQGVQAPINIIFFSPWNPWATFPTAQALAGTRA